MKLGNSVSSHVSYKEKQEQKVAFGEILFLIHAVDMCVRLWIHRLIFPLDGIYPAVQFIARREVFQGRA